MTQPSFRRLLMLHLRNIKSHFVQKKITNGTSKGQLISERLFDVLNFPKNMQKFNEFLL